MQSGWVLTQRLRDFVFNAEARRTRRSAEKTGLVRVEERHEVTENTVTRPAKCPETLAQIAVRGHKRLSQTDSTECPEDRRTRAICQDRSEDDR